MEHIANMAADARFAELAEETAEVHATSYGATAEAATRDAVATSRRVRMEAARKDFLAQMSQHEGTVRGIWGRNSEEYLRFYPDGATEYYRANLQNIDEKLTRYETAAREFEPELPPVFLKAFLAEPGGENGKGGVILRFRAARAAQLKAIGAKTQGKLGLGSGRKLLENRLYKNVLLVTAELIDAPLEELEAAERLFPVHRLFKKKRGVKKAAGSGKKDDEAQDDSEDEEDDDTTAEAEADTATAMDSTSGDVAAVNSRAETTEPATASGFASPSSEDAGEGNAAGEGNGLPN